MSVPLALGKRKQEERMPAKIKERTVARPRSLSASCPQLGGKPNSSSLSAVCALALRYQTWECSWPSRYWSDPGQQIALSRDMTSRSPPSFCPILFRPPLHSRRQRVLELQLIGRTARSVIGALTSWQREMVSMVLCRLSPLSMRARC
jgi:hypothetical protein